MAMILLCRKCRSVLEKLGEGWFCSECDDFKLKGEKYDGRRGDEGKSGDADAGSG